jgi:hypothetical protein
MSILIALGSIWFAIQLFKEWRAWRERQWVKDTLKPGAGLDYGIKMALTPLKALTRIVIAIGLIGVVAALFTNH